jgi:hypothetical protein
VCREQAATANEQHSRSLSQTQVTCQDILKKIVRQGQWQVEIIAAIERSHSRNASWSDFVVPPTAAHKGSIGRSTENLHRTITGQLYISEVERRYEKISLAHKKTFHWVFRSPARRKEWTNFPSWMADNSAPLYWITGKAGSGKSTVMRFLVDHKETRTSLQAWAGSTRLVTAFFFFWNSGSALQMSYEGLVRSLLYQILDQAPELVPIALPHKVEAAMLLGEQIYQRIEAEKWTWEELLRAFRLIIKTSASKYKIAFFIDGMDEFKGKPSDLIDFILSLTTPWTKVCAASRPWIVFEDAFGRRPHLRLEDLTHNDINHYVNSRMSASPGFRALHELDSRATREIVDNVCKKSSGVFLWVQLVTESLLDGLSGGEKIFELQQRLQSLPEDLEDLFRKVLEGLTDQHLTRVAQFLQLVRGSSEPLTLLDMSFADEDDKRYALEAPCVPIDQKEANGRAELMRRRLIACCKGLLEAKAGPQTSLPDTHVQYLHRTVKDWLEQEMTTVKLANYSRPDFDVNIRLYTVHLMKLKRCTWKNLQDKGDNAIWDPAEWAIVYATRADPQGTNNQISMLNEIDKAAIYLTTTRMPNGLTYLERESESWGGTAGHWTWTSIPSRECKGFLGLAVLRELLDYVDATLKDMPTSEAAQEASRLIELARENDVNTALLQGFIEQFRFEEAELSSQRRRKWTCWLCFG